ncbi:MAG: type II secretion system protein, partial [Minisyncoccia bacterium]
MSFLKKYFKKLFSQESFTITELIVTISVIAVLMVIVLLSVNPITYTKQARDSRRVSDLKNLNSAISLFRSDTQGQYPMGSSSVVYISIPDIDPNCSNLGLPAPTSGWSYHCVPSSTLRNTDGTGWIPIDFTKQSFGKSLSSLPVDPINQTSTLNYYSYIYDPLTGKYELNAKLESPKYQDIATTDGGDNNNLYEVGLDLALSSKTALNAFIKTIGGADDDSLYSLSPTSDGGYILGGYT